MTAAPGLEPASNEPFLNEPYQPTKLILAQQLLLLVTAAVVFKWLAAPLTNWGDQQNLATTGSSQPLPLLLACCHCHSLRSAGTSSLLLLLLLRP
jgi:hypothetical protein